MPIATCLPPSKKFHCGDIVTVASASEILRTLDEYGRLDGLPFAPQMVNYCGQRFKIIRWANNACYFEPSGRMRFGQLPECVVLNTVRCCGDAYGGCDLGCSIVWKTAWLRHSAKENLNQGEIVSQASDLARKDREDRSELLRIGSAHAMTAGRASCQATQLHQLAISSLRIDPTRYVQEMSNNRTSLHTLTSSFCSRMLARAKNVVKPIRGTNEKTPHASLDLQPGEVVRVKSRTEIENTLDRRGKNRGLSFERQMLDYCGSVLKVSRRVETLVDEATGKINKLKIPSVILEDLHCSPRQNRLCSRMLYFMWREIWLERVDSNISGGRGDLISG